MRYIKQISVIKLFGLFDHLIPLNSSENVTIIHGPNGIGKTIMLKMIDSLSRNEFDLFYRVPFEVFQVSFDDGSHLSIKRVVLDSSKKTSKIETDENKTDLPIELLCNFRLSSAKSENFYIRRRQNPLEDISDIQRFIETLTQRFTGVSFRSNTTTNTGSFFKGKTEYTIHGFIEEYGDRLTLVEKQYLIFHMSQPPSGFYELIADMMIRLISTQRLVSIKDGKNLLQISSEEVGSDELSSIGMFSKELSEIMSAKNNEYAALSQELDSTFPNRVITKSLSGEIKRPYEELLIELINLEEKRSALRKVGLLDPGKTELLKDIPSDVRLDSVAGVFEIYIQDAQAKLRVFEELADQISLLMKIINERFMFKKFKADRRRGFVIELSNHSELSPTYLSSGEQHEVILTYELLFKVNPKSLVIIDEPEISLHLAWQEAFLRDIIAIAKLRDFNVLIATHSPSIVGGRWDLAIDLIGERDDDDSEEVGFEDKYDEIDGQTYEPYSDEEDDLGD